MNAEILHTIDRWEGGYNNVPGDAGGETNWGISKAQYPSVDIEHLTKDEAVQIYARDYWKPLSLDQIVNVRLRWKIFDIAVQRGPLRAVMMVQGVLGVQADGKIGPQTLSALNAAQGNDLLYEIAFAQIDHYIDRSLKDDTQRQFLRGWVKRAFDVGEDLT